MIRIPSMLVSDSCDPAISYHLLSCQRSHGTISGRKNVHR